MQAVPSQWHTLLDAGFDQPGMTAMVGGEALPLDLARRLRAKVNILFNGYGPTETTVVSTLWPVPRDPDSISIGSPIANTTVSIVDELGQRVGPRGAGELIIGGVGVADGYLNRPGLTASRFIAGPAYRTGDRCRWRADGTLEFLGRDDGQVKIRGQRVELGDVEAGLSGFPGVLGVVAVVHEDALVAYVVPDGAGSVTAAGLRTYAATVVPSSMVPSRVVVLDRFPLTANGKVDRAALPRPGADDAAVVPTSPADPLTAALCAICRDVLGVAQVRPDDDLFDLGAHSMSVMQIVARVEQRWHITVSADVFYDADRVVDAARAIGALTAEIS
jgi:acyl-CoA synthetase (AMP-forming)/AMP-acid ligase II/acyl carrier protein